MKKSWKIVSMFLVFLLLLTQMQHPMTAFAKAELESQLKLNIQTTDEATLTEAVVHVFGSAELENIKIKLPVNTSYNKKQSEALQQKGITVAYDSKQHELLFTRTTDLQEWQTKFVLSDLQHEENSLILTGIINNQDVIEKRLTFHVDLDTDKQKHSPEKNEVTTQEQSKKTVENSSAKDKMKEDEGKEDKSPKKNTTQEDKQHEISSQTFSRQKVSNKPPIQSTWPEPGSLKLNKEATATDEYAEWEVELTVEGKDLKRSSDIVLVFDRSNSMVPSRLKKAKLAANQFVDQLLVENATTRIALVPFASKSDPYTGFIGYNSKTRIKNAINAIRVTGGNDGGTNIQAGLHQAQKLLDTHSNADRKTIVLLSDGEPTFSFMARNAEAYAWPNNKYNFILSDFDYNSRIGRGNSYGLGWLDRYRLGWYRVETNGIATISEAAHIINSGLDIYSIGLEVGRNRDARYVLHNSQNKGYYEGGEDDLRQIFAEVAKGLSSYAANGAVVTDPIGKMFNLVKDGSYRGKNFAASHGEVKWDDANETFTWDIGDIKENETYTLKYKVTIDWDENPKGNEVYPTNGDTPLNYTEPNGNPQTKPFPIPKAGIDKGKIIKQGYRVNVDGQPVDKDGNIVSDPSEAEQFYEEVHKEDGEEELKFNEAYQVIANDIADYTLRVGNHSERIDLQPDKPIETVWFGYVKATDLIAGDVTAEYVDEKGNQIANSEVFSGEIGDTYTTKQKNIPGYTFVKVDEEGAPATGKFQKEAQIVRYIYKQKLGTITIQKVDEHGKALQGATFELKGNKGQEIESQTTNEDGLATFENLPWGKYELVETKAPEGYRLLNKPLGVEITGENLHEELEVENSKNSWLLPDTGGIGTLLFYGFGAAFMLAAILLLLRKKKAAQPPKE
ncbi:hypothetical protein J32TS6_12260 [Virgibacillus pantothenticus]|uniref:adhesive domain-containing protein n=1 Tax=Virgibacillus pantothenticus TaxID=1473 RepID=UPI001B1DD71F|nr:adhesive domain-containing protein [Virgibacillus pantothenticus]GIP62671.1 hypothetical protein J32TS6_12260 [Virgibacillus pantothenticus]